MTKPFDNQPKVPDRIRRLKEMPFSERGVPEESTDEISREDLSRLFDYQAFVINKATALLREVNQEAAKLTIPVDPDAIQVRTAIRRQDGSDGSVITFDLYKAMYDEQVKRARKLKFEIVGDLTGDPYTDSIKIKKVMKGGGDGLSKWDEFLLNMEPWLIWFLLNQLIGQHQGIEHQEACAAKTPPATEIGPIQLRIAISMAAMMLILGMQEDHVLFAVSQPSMNFPMPGKELLAQAKRLIKSDGLHRQLTEIQGATDPMVITQYADNYISRHPEGYEAWFAYRDLRDTREEVITTYYHAHQYSEDHRSMLSVSTITANKTPDPFVGIPNPLGTGRGVRIVNPATSTMSNAYYRSLIQSTSIADRNITAIGGVLTSGFALDMLCCFARFMLKSGDIDQIRKIRNLIALAYGASTNGISLSVMTPRGVLNWAMRSIQHELIGHVHRAFDNVVDDVAGWVLDIDPDLMEDLSYCPLIYDLIMMINEGIAFLQTRLFDLIRQFLVGFEDSGEALFARWGTMYDLRRLATILSILDRILATLEMCARDEDGSGDGVDFIPDPGEDDSFYDGVPRPLKLPSQVIEKFFANRQPILRGPAERPIPAPGTDISSQESTVTLENYREFCTGIVPDALIKAVFPESN